MWASLLWLFSFQAQADWAGSQWLAVNLLDSIDLSTQFYALNIDSHGEESDLLLTTPGEPVKVNGFTLEATESKFVLPIVTNNALKKLVLVLEVKDIQDARQVIVFKVIENGGNRVSFEGTGVYSSHSEIVDISQGSSHNEVLLAVKGGDGAYSIIRLNISNANIEGTTFNFSNDGIQKVLGAKDVDGDGRVEFLYIDGESKLYYMKEDSTGFSAHQLNSNRIGFQDERRKFSITDNGVVLLTDQGLVNYKYDGSVSVISEGPVTDFQRFGPSKYLIAVYGGLTYLHDYNSEELTFLNSNLNIVRFYASAQGRLLVESNGSLYVATREGDVPQEEGQGEVIDVNDDENENNQGSTTDQQETEEQYSYQSSDKDLNILFICIGGSLLVVMLIILCVLLRGEASSK